MIVFSEKEQYPFALHVSFPSCSSLRRSYLASGNCFNPIGEGESLKLHLPERVGTLITMCFRHSGKDDYKLALSWREIADTFGKDNQKMRRVGVRGNVNWHFLDLSEL